MYIVPEEETTLFKIIGKIKKIHSSETLLFMKANKQTRRMKGFKYIYQHAKTKRLILPNGESDFYCTAEKQSLVHWRHNWTS